MNTWLMVGGFSLFFWSIMQQCKCHCTGHEDDDNDFFDEKEDEEECY